MWRAVAPLLKRPFHRRLCRSAGLRPRLLSATRADHAPHAKRAMARQMAAVMGSSDFAASSPVTTAAGVSYRLALDRPDRVERLAVLDVRRSRMSGERADKRLMTGYWPWSLLAQDEPLPRRLLTAAPDAVWMLRSAAGVRRRAASMPSAGGVYRKLRDPVRAHAICEEYRAAATIEHERRGRSSPDGASHVRYSCYGAARTWALV